MNNKIFNSKLYFQTLARIKLVGIISAIVCFIISCIPIINTYLNYAENIKTILSPKELTPVMFVFAYAGAFVFTFIALSFMNKRGASDLYFSLPNTRVCTVISIGLAAITWVVAIIILTSAVSYFGYVAIGVNMVPLKAVMYTVKYVIIALVVIGCTIIGMSLTGTVLSNIAATGIVMLLPRAIIIFVQAIIYSSAQVLTVESFGTLFNPTNNLAAEFLSFPVTGLSTGPYKENDFSYLYTSILVVMYFVVAILLFKSRKSETAGKYAPNRFMQAVYRCCLTLPFLLAFIFCFTYFSEEGSIRTNAVFVLSALFGAVVVYFLYEAVTTKKFKCVLKSIPLFFGVAGIAVLLAFAGNSVGMVVRNNTPNAQEIVGISKSITDTYYIPNSYGESITDYIEVKDEEAVKIALESLDTTINGRSNYYDREIFFTFNMKNGDKIHRRTKINDSQFNTLENIFVNDSRYLDGAKCMPKYEDIRDLFFDTGNNMNKIGAKAVYDELVKEVAAMSPEEFKRYRSIFFGAQLNVSTLENGRLMSDSYPINVYTPNTLKEYLKISENSKKIQEFITATGGGPDKSENIICNFFADEPGAGNYTLSYGSKNPSAGGEPITQAEAAEINNILAGSIDRVMDEKYQTVTFEINKISAQTEENKYGGDSFTRIVVLLTEEELDSIIAIAYR